MPNIKKVALVDQLKSTLRDNPNVALVSFEKTTHIALESLRKSLRGVGASLRVVKTSLLQKAVEGTNELTELKEKAFPVKGSAAIVHMGPDWSAGLKAVFDFAKKDGTLAFRFGMLEKTVYDKLGLERLAQLPSKVELLGKVVGSLKSPVYRVDHAIKFPMTYFVNVLKARSTKG
ncbi:MAG TPA: 50S ribosomal protein L10 [Candidatus Woesebacteria bacterium]|nr:50S ribosomal protein L10 [Candidatus Woesebacteria bacterium]HNS94360.1 50S ribosomal protein L10 [Candidatus Woesebacteria bacterium]